MIQLGWTTPELLETLTGGLVSCLQFRRRCLSILDHVYRPRPSCLRTQSFALSLELRDELLVAVALLPQADVDFRSIAAPVVIASDASSSAEAAAACSVPVECSQELYRHTLAKGLWNRLLAPYPSLLREKDLLAPEDELPDLAPATSRIRCGKRLLSHPGSWTSVASPMSESDGTSTWARSAPPSPRKSGWVGSCKMLGTCTCRTRRSPLQP